jgi:uncharacterized protein
MCAEFIHDGTSLDDRSQFFPFSTIDHFRLRSGHSDQPYQRDRLRFVGIYVPIRYRHLPTMLMGLGVAPPIASASVHTTEVFTTAVSGTAHWRLGNVDVALLHRLAFAGVVGGATGAYLSTVLPGSVIRPIVSLYLLAMGIVIVWRAISRFRNDRSTAALGSTTTHVAPLGVVSGLLDAIGGGGWGAMMTSTLIGWRMTPRLAIGSANAAEFFVTSVVTATFVATIGLELWPIITGLVTGGVLAAPFAAFMTRKLPERPLMFLVGAVIVVLSLRGLLQSLH